MSLPKGKGVRDKENMHNGLWKSYEGSMQSNPANRLYGPMTRELRCEKRELL